MSLFIIKFDRFWSSIVSTSQTIMNTPTFATHKGPNATGIVNLNKRVEINHVKKGKLKEFVWGFLN